MFDVKDEGLGEFELNLGYLINNLPKETQMILRKAGTKARTIIARTSRKIVKKHTGYYHKHFKRGKVWVGNDGLYKIRVYNNSPHAHLLEDGHRIVGKDGSEHGFQPGYKVMERANKEVEQEWDEILNSEIDKMLDKM